jgi:transposase-like protein
MNCEYDKVLNCGMKNVELGIIQSMAYKKIMMECLECSKEFMGIPDNGRNKPNKFCSRSCSSSYNSRRQEALTADKIKQIINLYTEQRLSTIKIAERLEMSSTTARKVLKERGLMRNHHNAVNAHLQREEQVLDNELIREWIVKYHNGETLKSIAENSCFPTNKVSQILKDNSIDVKIRSKYSLNHNAFNVLNDESAYWIGLLLTDGWVLKNNRQLGIKLKESDRATVEALRQFLSYSGPLSVHKTSKAIQLIVRSEQLINDLACHGVIPRKSLIAKPSDAVASITHFWRGVLDGDGSIYIPQLKHPIRISLVSASKEFINAFKSFLENNEIKYMHHERMRNSINIIYDVCCESSHAYKLLELVGYFDVNLPVIKRKSDRALLIKKHLQFDKGGWLRRTPTFNTAWSEIYIGKIEEPLAPNL